jgi:hypothetical protein
LLWDLEFCLRNTKKSKSILYIINIYQIKQRVKRGMRKAISLTIIGLMAISIIVLSVCSQGSSITETEGKIAFDREGDVWVIDANGTNQEQLTQSNRTFGFPAWSYDNKYIAFEEGTFNGIWVVNCDGSNLKEIRDLAGTPSWSPNGSIVFGESEAVMVVVSIMPLQWELQLHFGISKMSPDGSNIERLLNLGKLVESGGGRRP